MSQSRSNASAMLGILVSLANALGIEPDTDTYITNLGDDYLAICPLGETAREKLAALMHDDPAGPLGPGLMIAVPKRKSVEAVQLLAAKGITIDAGIRGKQNAAWSDELRQAVIDAAPADYFTTNKDGSDVQVSAGTDLPDFPRPMGAKVAQTEPAGFDTGCDCDICRLERDRLN